MNSRMKFFEAVRTNSQTRFFYVRRIRKCSTVNIFADIKQNPYWSVINILEAVLWSNAQSGFLYIDRKENVRKRRLLVRPVRSIVKKLDAAAGAIDDAAGAIDDVAGAGISGGGGAIDDCLNFFHGSVDNWHNKIMFFLGGTARAGGSEIGMKWNFNKPVRVSTDSWLNLSGLILAAQHSPNYRIMSVIQAMIFLYM